MHQAVLLTVSLGVDVQDKLGNWVCEQLLVCPAAAVGGRLLRKGTWVPGETGLWTWVWWLGLSCVRPQ